MDEQEEGYFDQCIGAVITAIHDDDESVWIHLSDGSVLEFYATAEGFDFDIHAEVSH